MKPPIVVLRGRVPAPGEPEYREWLHYESGEAERAAAAWPGAHDEPWLNVRDSCEPNAPAIVEELLTRPDTRDRFRGEILDLGAGTCWVTARLSQLPAVERVTALDMSERFLTTVGSRVIDRLGGRRDRLRFVVSVFDAIPLPTASIDLAVMCACLHHALSPLRALLEVRRVLRPDGALLLIESGTPPLALAARRRDSLALMRDSGCTELVYTVGEFVYGLQAAGFTRQQRIAVDGGTRTPWRRAVRRLLRRIGLEDWLLPVDLVIVAQPPA